MAKQLKRYVETYVVSMQRHIHMHKNLHSAMLRTWRKSIILHSNRLEIRLGIKNGALATNRLVAA